MQMEHQWSSRLWKMNNNKYDVSMKKMILYICLVLLTCGCYEDKGNYSYEEFDEVAINLPGDRVDYEVSLGASLRIDTKVSITSEKEEFDYIWEIYYAGDFYQFTEGEQLECVFGPSEYVPSAGSYIIRLRVKHRTNGIQYYSKLLTINVVGSTTGLLVLHGDQDSCDIALVRASEFLGTEPVEPIESQFYPNWYSSINGRRIPGEGLCVIHSYTSDTDPERCYVIALTEDNGVCVDYKTGIKKMDYNELFEGGLNKQQPKAFFAIDMNEVALDGGDIFVNAPSGAMWGGGSLFFSTPFISTEKNYYFAPYVFAVDGWNYGADAVLFDSNSCSFLQVQGFWGGSTVISSFIETGTGKFTLANMNAELLYMDRGGASGHHVAVMKDRTNGNIFAVELDFSADIPDNIPYARYDLNGMANVENAKAFGFGDNNPNMCYYASGSIIYRYLLLPDVQPESSLLTMADGKTPVSFDGEITMMKILKPNEVWGKFSYYMYNKIMVVGTWNGVEGTLYAFELDENGNVKREICQEKGLKTIVDAAIKGL